MTTVFVLNLLLTVLLAVPAVLSTDVFCGTLTIFEQQRFGLNSVAISSQETTDLKQCLELCCSVITTWSWVWWRFKPGERRQGNAASTKQIRSRMGDEAGADCRGVTFTGVIVPHEGEPNCLLVGCRDQCIMNDRAEYTDGLISVLINRTQTT
ncbi:hypothetical protein OSTOST_06543, partial [Ostertagia ostertagi]